MASTGFDSEGGWQGNDVELTVDWTVEGELQSELKSELQG